VPGLQFSFSSQRSRVGEKLKIEALTPVTRPAQGLKLHVAQYDLAVTAKRQSIIGEPVIPAGEQHCAKGRRSLHQIDLGHDHSGLVRTGAGRRALECFYVTLVRRGSEEVAPEPRSIEA